MLMRVASKTRILLLSFFRAQAQLKTIKANSTTITIDPELLITKSLVCSHRVTSSRSRPLFAAMKELVWLHRSLTIGQKFQGLDNFSSIRVEGKYLYKQVKPRKLLNSQRLQTLRHMMNPQYDVNFMVLMFIVVIYIKVGWMIEKEAVVKTPIELQLEKINFPNLLQYKNIELEYHLLRVLSQILSSSSEMVNTQLYFKLFSELLNFDEIESIKMLPLFERFSYRLWNNEHLSIELREKTSFYRIVSNWIINFELRSGKLDTVFSQIQLILNFMRKETRTVLERLVMVEEIYEDLKQLINEEFWEEEKDIKMEQSTVGKFKNQLQPEPSPKEEQCTELEKRTIESLFELLESILNPLFYRVHQKDKLYRNCTYGSISFENVRQFVKKTIFFILKQKNLPTQMQTQLTRVSLIFLQYLSQEESKDILNIIKHLMIKTSKAVRFALVVEYVQFYEYLQFMGFDDVIEQLQNIIYFRQLIIGKKIVEESIMEIGNNINDLNFSYQQLYIKAGISKKVYFSNETEDCVLKLDLLIEENDINIKIFFFDNILIEGKPSNLSKFVFETIGKINQYDGSKVKGNKEYWGEERATSKKLELRLQNQGLYCLEFDNSYSWVIPKHLRYRLELYKPLI